MKPIILNTEKREIYGKKLRSLRKKGILPIHVYGPGMKSIALQSDTNNVLKVISCWYCGQKHCFESNEFKVIPFWD